MKIAESHVKDYKLIKAGSTYYLIPNSIVV